MKKRQLLPVITALLMSLTACSQSQLTQFQQQLSDITSQPAPGAQPSAAKEADRHDVVSVYTLPAGTGVDTAAMRLKQHFGFSSDEDVAAARNSGQGNAGWSASAISEGTSWLAQNRFAECCDDPESGGHDLEKEQVKRLEKIGLLRRSGRISFTTDFGDFVLAAAGINPRGRRHAQG
ncbi:hypothetical protein A3780_20290 [Kosakonia radicincitans]|uniref:hypothetical protein n=1 Tax=Kosakonia radicincitans TaxID=283686 RepID=UPI000903E3EB|nr:hypothetical protein [Kosakonia radicincitans]APG19785.1 hypothetical protein A3780_20290 [Kosakonia radicincitans]